MTFDLSEVSYDELLDELDRRNKMTEIEILCGAPNPPIEAIAAVVLEALNNSGFLRACDNNCCLDFVLIQPRGADNETKQILQ